MKADAIVIGGGIVGCLTAFYLHKNGLRDVLIVDRGRFGGASTGQSASPQTTPQLGH